MRRFYSVFSLKFLTALCCLALASCGDTDDVPPPPPVILETVELQALYDEADFRALVAAVKAKEQAEQATDPDYILQARGYLALLDSIGAALALEKLQEEQRDTDVYVLLRARTLLMDGALNRAVRIVTDHEFGGENIYEAQVLLGDMQFLQGEFMTAVAHYSSAAELAPSKFEAYIGRAQTYLRLGSIDQAEADALLAVRHAPNNTLSHYVLGTVYNQKAQFDDAKTQFQRAVDLYPYNVQALLGLVNTAILEGDYAGAETLLDTVYSVSPEDNTAKFFSAMLLAVKGDDTAAREHLIKLSFVGDANPQTARLLGHVAYRLGERDLALRKLQSVLEVAPFDRVSRLIAAEILLSDNAADEALLLLNPMVADINTTDLSAVSMAATATAVLGDFDRAIAYSKRAIELAEAPDQMLDASLLAQDIKPSTVAVMKRQLASYHFSNGETNAAAAVLEQMIKEDAGDTTSLLLLSNIHMQDGNYSAAIVAAKRLIDTHPSSPLGHNALAATLHRQGGKDEALAAYDRAIDLAPGYVSARKNRGTLYLEQTAYDKAAEDLKTVLDATPDDVQTQFMYARALVGLKRPDEALDYFNDVAKVFPNSVNVLLYRSRAVASVGRHGEAAALVEDALEQNKIQNAVPTSVLEETLASYRAVLAAEEAEKQREAAEAAEREKRAEQRLREAAEAARAAQDAQDKSKKPDSKPESKPEKPDTKSEDDPPKNSHR